MSKWAILIASALQRHDQLNSLLAFLETQKRGYDVEVIAIVDDCQMPLDAKRNALISIANSEYVSFIDDDDVVPDDYVSTIYPLLDGVDYVGFQLQHYWDGRKDKPTYHSLRYSSWSEDGDAYYRNISHLNPIKRDIAKKFRFRGTFGEDLDWAMRVARSKQVTTEHYIDRVMYYYYYDSNQSLTTGK